MPRRNLLAVLMLLTAVADIRSAPANQTHTIQIKGFAFVPKKLEVNLGDTVIWMNEDIVPHTATAPKAFNSKNLAKNQSWSFVAKQKGTYPYICSYHPTMTGELVVQ